MIVVGYLFAGLTILFKSQIFVAISLLAWLYPPIFMHRIGRGWRAAWIVLALAAFIACVEVAGRSERVPTLQLDGSWMKDYMNYLNNSGSGRIRDRLSGLFAPESSPLTVATAGAALLLFGTFGWFGVDYFIIALLSRKKMRLDARLFPLLVMVNYLIMALGLAVNRTSIGSFDELHHKPFAWAYFVVAMWVGGSPAGSSFVAVAANPGFDPEC